MVVTPSVYLYDFQTDSPPDDWQVEDDTVMGGVSQGHFRITREGHGLFTGTVSLENNGGFSSVQHNMPIREVSRFSKVVLRVKGDGKTYQVRVKSDRRERPSYVAEFATTGEWQLIEVPFDQLRPTFRGRRLNIPNYPGQTMEQVRILIGNKKPQDFRLLIDWIGLE